MKNNRKILSGLFILLVAIIYLPVNARQKNGTKDVIYQLDLKKSRLLWKAPKNEHNGFILFNSGYLNNVVACRPTQGAFNVDMNSMRSTDQATAEGRKKVDDKLRSENFFAVSKYPAANIVVKKIELQPGGKNSRVYGELKIKNVTKPIQFTAMMKQNSRTIIATADMSISRAAWNIDHQPKPTYWNPLELLQDKLVDDDIPVKLELVFNRK